MAIIRDLKKITLCLKACLKTSPNYTIGPVTDTTKKTSNKKTPFISHISWTIPSLLLETLSQAFYTQTAAANSLSLFIMLISH